MHHRNHKAESIQSPSSRRNIGGARTPKNRRQYLTLWFGGGAVCIGVITYLRTATPLTESTLGSMPFESLIEHSISRLDEIDIAIQAKERALVNAPLRYYMYDEPNITLHHLTFQRNKKHWEKFQHETLYDDSMMEALEISPLRTEDPNEADLFIPPIPMGAILVSEDKDFDFPFRELVKHPLFRKHQGNRHILISTPNIFYRSNKIADVIWMRKWHAQIYNMTPALSWDPNAVINAIKEGVDFREYTTELKEATAMSRRSFSVGLGSSPGDIDLHLASMEKFRRSSNLIFYQTRTEVSYWNSTMFRHAPVTNITRASFPKSSIGFGLKDKGEWLRELGDSKFCLVIRGDTPHSKALWRSIRCGCILVVASDTLPICVPMCKSTLRVRDYAVISKEGI